MRTSNLIGSPSGVSKVNQQESGHKPISHNSTNELTSGTGMKYVPPNPDLIDRFARDLCQRLAEQIDPAYNHFDVVVGFADFVKIVAQLEVNRLNNQVCQ